MAGGFSGYLSSGGSWKGAAFGALGGGAIGLINPAGASAVGSAIGGFASSVTGQMEANTINPCKRFYDIDWDLAAVSGLFGGLGRGLFNYINDPARNAFAYTWNTRFGSVSPAVSNTVAAYIKGSMSGVAQWFYKSNTFTSTPAACGCS
jgi:hypothetical protein